MSIPGFQEFMLPVLRLAGTKEELRLRDAVESMSNEFDLSKEERSAVLPSGQNTVVQNRVAWARTYLVKAGLLESIRRGYVRITDRGRQLLDKQVQSLDVAYLREHCPEINDFITGSTDSGDTNGQKDSSSSTSGETPVESLELAYQRLRQELANEILDQVKELSPQSFERLVVELLVKMGYGGTLKDAGRAVGQSGDGGIDGIIKEDRLGLDTIYLQAKRYTEQAVGRPAVQAFVGALQGVRARKGIFITTSRFAAPAIEYTGKIDTKVVLIDGPQLAGYMIDFNLGVTKVNTFEVKRLDSDYFDQA